MRLKIIFGIVIPVVIIIILTVLGSLKIGFSVRTDYVDSLVFQDYFVEAGFQTNVRIGEVKVTNDYFLGKRYELVSLGACMVDKSEGKPDVSAGTVSYSKGDYSLEKDLIYGNSVRTRSVEVGAYGAETVTMYLQTSYNFRYTNYSDFARQFGDYDELVIYELGERGSRAILSPIINFGSCGDLDDLEITARIPLVI